MSDSIVDPRDGERYRVVRLRDGRFWFAENLRYEMPGSVPADPNPPEECLSKEFPYDPSRYGRLYSHTASAKAAPPGWHVPSAREWKRMLKRYGGYGHFGDHSYRRVGRDDSVHLIRNDLNAHFGGSSDNAENPAYPGKVYFGGFLAGRFWTTSKPWHDRKSGIYFLLYLLNGASGFEGVVWQSQENPWKGFSIRCIKD